jgi:hypothetical protein
LIGGCRYHGVAATIDAPIVEGFAVRSRSHQIGADEGMRACGGSNDVCERWNCQGCMVIGAVVHILRLGEN